MEYIECTHCGKRYAVNENIRDSEGQFAKCKSCHEKFMLVVHDSEKRGLDTENDKFNATMGWGPTVTAKPFDADTGEDEVASAGLGDGGWDPSLTMPESDTAQLSSDEPVLDEEQIKAKAEATLAAIQKEKKKKYLTYTVLGFTIALLLMTLYMTFMGDDAQTNQVNTQAIPSTVRQSAEDVDKNSPECREAAAKQWLIDYRAMYADYSAETFVDILKQSEAQMVVVKERCRSPRLLKNIIASVTSQKKPEWFAAEIKAFQQ